jgi:adenylate cyclase
VPIETFRRRLLPGLIGGLAAVLVGFLPPGEFFELKGYDLLHLVKGAGHPSREIVIVAIDEASLAELGLRWPWPRNLHGRLVEELHASGASVVGFDVIFSEPASPAEDAAFAGAIRKNGVVVLASDVETVPAKNYVQEIAVEPLPMFAENARAGLASVTVDRDHVVRKLFPLKEGDRFFAQEIALAHSGKAGKAPAGAYIAYNPPRSYTTVSYYQALNPAKFLPEGAFKGKIVIVGRVLKTSPEPGRPSGDMFATPHLFAGESGLMSGAEIQANLVDGFLHGAFVERLDRRISVVLFLLAGLAGGLLQGSWRPLRSGLLTGAAVLACLAAASYLFLRHLVWIPAVMTSFALGVPYAAAGLQAYFQSESKRREIRRIFSHYLSPAVLETLLADPGKVTLAGRKTEATVLFCDIAGFTSLSENLAPEDVARLLNRYFDETTRIILSRGGTVDKFIGDAAMAFWGDPLPDPEHAYHACEAALEIQERIGRLAEELKKDGLPGIEVRIGICSGIVVVGNMGSSDLYNYTVLGDTVNTASRLEGANKECGTKILISGSAREKAGSLIEARRLEPVALRGKSRNVEVYELIGLREASPPEGKTDPGKG